MKKNSAHVVWSLALLLLVAGLGGCGRGDAVETTAPAGAPVAVRVARVQQRDIAQTVDLTGEVVAANAVSISATVEGPIGFCPWREGDRVRRAGDKLLVIERPMYRAEVESARAALSVAGAKLADLKAGARPEEIAQAKESIRRLEEAASFARTDLERTAALVARQVVPGETLEKAQVTLVDWQTQLETARQRLAMLQTGPTPTQSAVAEAAVEEAAARVKLAEAKLAECTLVAPFAGIISRVHVRVGDMATAKAPLLEMFDPGSLVVRFAVPEAVAIAVREGMDVSVRFDAMPGRVMRAKVGRVYADVDRRMRTRTVEAIAEESSPLVPGMFARVRLTLAAAPEALVIPAEAILSAPGQPPVVFVVNDGKAHRTPIRIGIAEGGFVQVLEGLSPTQQVAVGGLGRLKDGMPVSIATPPAPPTTRVAEVRP